MEGYPCIEEEIVIPMSQVKKVGFGEDIKLAQVSPLVVRAQL